MTVRYEVKWCIIEDWYVFDNDTWKKVFTGPYESCVAWIKARAREE